MLHLSNIAQFSTSSGANKSIYAPEPFDVGRILQADIISNDQRVTVTTACPIDPGWYFSKMLNMNFFPKILLLKV